MAAEAAARQALVSLGMSEDAANSFYGDQALTEIEHYQELHDLKGNNLKVLVGVVRKPGGGDDGHQIPFRAEQNLALALCMINHQVTCGRAVGFADIRPANLGEYRAQLKLERAYEDTPKPDTPKLDWNKPVKVLSTLETFLSGHRGVHGTPLGYVLRKRGVPPAAGDDPAGNYRSKDEEKRQRAPIFLRGAADPTEEDGPFDPYFVADDRQAFDLILPLFQAPSTIWLNVKSSRNKMSARILVATYREYALGANRIDHEVKQLTKVLQTIRYTGESRNWNLDKFLDKHTDTHGQLEELVAYGYSGLDQRLAVSYMNDGMKAAYLQAAKTQIMSSTALRNSFDDSAALYHDCNLSYQAENPTASSDRKISAVASGTVEDRFYPSAEFKKLSEEQKQELFRLRDERGGASEPRGKPKGNSKKDKAAQNAEQRIANQRRELKAMKRKFKKQERKIAQLKSAAAGDSDSDSSDDSGELAAARR